MRVRTEAKREAILEAAAAVFFEAGFEGASMAQIAARVGGSKRTIYGYFPSKEHLFVAVAQHQADRFIEPIVSALSQTSDELPIALQRFGEDMLGFLCTPDSIRIWQTIIGVSGRSDIGAQFYEDGPGRGVREVAQFLKRQMALGQLRHADPQTAACHLLALLEAETLIPCLLGYLKAPTKAYLCAVAERAVQGFLAGYGTPDAQITSH